MEDGKVSIDSTLGSRCEEVVSLTLLLSLQITHEVKMLLLGVARGSMVHREKAGSHEATR